MRAYCYVESLSVICPDYYSGVGRLFVFIFA